MKKHEQWGWAWAVVAFIQMLPVFAGMAVFIAPAALCAYNSYMCFTEPEYANKYIENEAGRKKQNEQKRNEKNGTQN
jgi:hypothetical protein